MFCSFILSFIFFQVILSDFSQKKNRNGKNMKIIDLNRMLEHISYKH